MNVAWMKVALSATLSASGPGLGHGRLAGKVKELETKLRGAVQPEGKPVEQEAKPFAELEAVAVPGHPLRGSEELRRPGSGRFQDVIQGGLGLERC